MASLGRLVAAKPFWLLDFGRVAAALLGAIRVGYGVPIAAVFGLVSSLIYVTRPDVPFPIFDDSYITLTYARNLAEFGKLSFDGEHWSTGATSPLHVAILAGLLKFGADPFRASVSVGVASHVLLSIGVLTLAWTIFRSQLAGLLAALAISFTSYAALDSGNGLETSLFMALIAFTLTAFFLARRNRDRGLLVVAGVLLGLSVLTRPEGALLAPALVVYRWVDRGEDETLRGFFADSLVIALPALVVTGLIAAYSLAINGTLGGTASTKMQFFAENEQSLRLRIEVASNHIGIFAGGVLPLVLLAIVGGNRRETLAFALFWLPVLALHTLLLPGGLEHYYYRYQHPALPLLAVLAGGGAMLLIREALRRDLAVKGLVVLGLALAVLVMQQQYERWKHVYTASSMETRTDLDAMARELNSIIRPDQVLATHDIGAVGYYADYGVIDLVGLVNPETVKYHHDRSLAEYVDRVRPDYLLTFPSWDTYFLHLGAAQNPEKFHLIKEYPAGPMRQHPYLLYRIDYSAAP